MKGTINSAADAAKEFKHLSAIEDHEECWVLFLSMVNVLLSKKMITVGTLRSAPMDTRRIVKEALLCNASGIILGHNHPSGDPTPSAGDIKETESLKKACNLFDIGVLDHIVVTKDGYYSFAEEKNTAF